MSFVIPQYREPQPIPSFGDDTASATAAAATVTYAAPGESSGHVIAGLIVSYDGGTVSGGNVQISDGSIVEFSLDCLIGVTTILFPMPKLCANNAPVTVTLASGGTGVKGKVNVLGHDIQPSTYIAGLDFSVNIDSGYLTVVL